MEILSRWHMDEWIMRPIGYIHCPYTDIAQIPRGPATIHTMEGILQVLPEFEKGLQDIEGFSHLMILWVFHKVDGYDLIASSLADNRPHGVFARRSPRRPNAIGLTTVELIRREGTLLHLRGIDMLNGTPAIDIKPYMSGVPMEHLRRGWFDEAEKGMNRSNTSV